MWLLAMIGIVIVFIILGIYLKFSSPTDSNQTTSSGSTNTFTGLIGWTKPLSGSNECQGYIFPSTQGSDGYVIPGQMTLNSEVLGSMTPGPQLSCIDSDQVNAILVTHTCDVIVGDVTDPESDQYFCISQDGSVIPYNDTESFYTFCGSGGGAFSTLFCPGELGIVSVGYVPNFIGGGSYLPALYYDDISDTVKLTSSGGSNAADSDQKFQIVRTVQGKYPTTDKSPGKQGMTGPYTMLYHRLEKKCLKPASLDGSGVPLGGTGLVLGDCDINEGFFWAFIGATPIMVDTGNKDKNGNPIFKQEGSTAVQLAYMGNALEDPDFNVNFNSQSDFFAVVDKYDIHVITNPECPSTQGSADGSGDANPGPCIASTPSMQQYDQKQARQSFTSNYASLTMYNYLNSGALPPP